MRHLALVAGVAALTLVGCGRGDDEAGTASGNTTTEVSTPSSPIDGRWVITDLGTLGGRAIAVNDRGQVITFIDTTQTTLLWEKGKTRDLGKLVPIAINNRGQVLSPSSVWENGRVTKLGSLGGGDTQAEDINDRGQVVGSSYVKGGTNHGFLWQNGEMRDLGTLGSMDSASDARAINERGQVVGSAATTETDEYGDEIEHAFLWENGKMRDLGTLGGPRSEALDINEQGQVIGVSDTGGEDGELARNAFLWENGTMVDLGALPLAAQSAFPPESSAAAINERGQIVGSSSGRAFLFQNGAMTDLGSLGGEAAAVDINDAGQIVGEAVKGYPVAHAFVWQSGRMTDLGVLRPRDRFSTAVDINTSGQVVGQSARCNSLSSDLETDCEDRAVLWTLKR